MSLPTFIIYGLTGFLTGLLTGLVVFIVYRARKNAQVQANASLQGGPKKATYSDPDACALILACRGYNDTGAENKYTAVESRAIPNKRLIGAYDIDNSFTTREPQRRKEFNSEAGRAIKMTEAKVCTPSE